MEDLFRFIMLRPPETAAEERTVSIDVPSDFQRRLKEARTGRSPRMKMIDEVNAYTASDAFVASPSTLAYYDRIVRFSDRVREQDQLDLSALRTLTREVFGKDAQTLTAEEAFRRDHSRAADSIVATKITPARLLGDMDALADAARVFDVIERIAAGDASLGDKGAARAALSRTILLPQGLFPLPSPLAGLDAPESARDEAAPEQKRREAEQLAGKLADVQGAIDEMMAVARSGFVEGEDAGAPQPSASGGDGDHGVFRRALRFLGALPRRADIGDASVNIAPLRTAPFTLKEEAVGRLGERTKTLLGELRIDLRATPVPLIVERLEGESVKLGRMLGALQPEPEGGFVVKHGHLVWGAPLWSGNGQPSYTYTPTPYTPTLPAGHGALQPVGIADLLVVKQQLKRYEAGEVAHVENVLKGEAKERKHRRLTRTEESFLTETEKTVEEERDLQSTERFELQRETSNTIKEDSNLKAGATLSAHGPWVEFSASVEFSQSTSKQESSRHASSYAKDVTVRSANKLSERVREERIRRTVEEFEETNQHTVDNTHGGGHVVGVYQWVDKVYEAQVFNYGKRLLFDIMAPEPAAFLIHALESRAREEALKAPEPFTLSPDEIDESNYHQYVQQYKVSGVEPPPPLYVTVSKAFERKAPSEETSSLTKAEVIQIPGGYEATHGSATCFFEPYPGIGFVDLAIGQRTHRWSWHSSTYAWSMRRHYVGDVRLQETWLFGLHYYELNSIAIVLETYRTEAYAVGIDIHCLRTKRRLDEWKIKTHAAIMQAYLLLQSNYEEKLAALATREGVQITGRNSQLNRILERTELKKSCIAALTAQHFDLFDAIAYSTTEGYPQPNIPEAEAEGRYIRFFEQAFEWEQMMYLFYPYYWGRKPNWRNRVFIEDSDPQYAAFLKAGAARVVLPVRAGFEKAILHFLETSKIWDGGGPPDVFSPFYLGIVEELKEQQGASGTEVPQGDPWEVRVPTTLVKLRDDSSLPAWRKDANGQWVPVNPGP